MLRGQYLGCRLRVKHLRLHSPGNADAYHMRMPFHSLFRPHYPQRLVDQSQHVGPS